MKFFQTKGSVALLIFKQSLNISKKQRNTFKQYGFLVTKLPAGNFVRCFATQRTKQRGKRFFIKVYEEIISVKNFISKNTTKYNLITI